MNFRENMPVIAITGSAGKTTVKTLISSILREKWIVFESGDYNNTTEMTKKHAGQINAIHHAAVLEYGMAYPGVIKEHCSIIKPNIGVITNIGLAHIGNFGGDISRLAAAKSELIEYMEPDGLLILNADDENSKLLKTDGFKGTIVKTGIDRDADYNAGDVEQLEDGMSFTVKLRGIDTRIFLPMAGVHNINNALLAVAVADRLGFDADEIEEGLGNAGKPKHRLDMHRLKDGITVIDDTVHAHPTAMKAAIDVLAKIGHGQKIAVLGSMPELGNEINEYHEKIGQYAAQSGIDFLFTYGVVSEYIGIGAIANGFPEDKVRHKTPLYRRVMHRELTQLIQPGATVLVKGASRLNMVETVDFLCEEYKPV